MNAGTIYGTEALIESMYERIEKEMGYPVKKILTGGYSELIVSLMPSDVIYDRYLNVDGLYQIYLKNKEQFL
jgi:type III pantothenate kinase